MTAVSDDGTPSLSDDEIVANVQAFVVAGTDTTAILIANVVHLLLQDRSRWEGVRSDPALIYNPVEETLGFRGPIRGLPRMTTRECEVGAVRIPKGAKVYWMPSSANRNESRYDSSDLHRPRPSGHLGFGALTHFGLGAPLARLELRIVLERLAGRIPELRLAPQTVEYVANLVTPGPVALEVEWDV